MAPGAAVTDELGSLPMESTLRGSAPGGLGNETAEPMHACTIVARNYLAQAQVLVDTFRKHHPDGTFDVLLVDEPGVERPSVDGADVVLIDEIGVEPDVLDAMAGAYLLIEFKLADQREQCILAIFGVLLRKKGAPEKDLARIGL